MEWIWSLATAIGGWWLGHWQSTQDRKNGIEEGAQAALEIEHSLVSFLLERDRERIKAVYSNANLSNPKEIRNAAGLAGNIYAEIIRRDAFSDARGGYYTEHDRTSWKRAFDENMPPVGYPDGYLQAIKDVLAGAEEYAF